MDAEELLSTADLNWRRPAADTPDLRDRLAATVDGPVVSLASDEVVADRLHELAADGAPHGTVVVRVDADGAGDVGGVVDDGDAGPATGIRTGTGPDPSEARLRVGTLCQPGPEASTPGRLLVAAGLAAAAAVGQHASAGSREPAQRALARPDWPATVVASRDGWHDGPFYAARPGPVPPAIGAVDVVPAPSRGGDAAVVVRLDVAGASDDARGDPAALAAGVVDHLRARCAAALDRFGALRREWRCKAATVGRRVRVDRVDGGADAVVGRAVDLTDRGGLVLVRDDGSTAVVDADARLGVERVDEETKE